MSMHKIPLTELERAGLTAHGLDIGKPSQLSDVFRHGVKWALDNAVPQWIPVSERLPYDDELVLVYDSEGTHGHVYTLRVYKQFFDKFKCVTHWMPLPKAPEQK